MSEAVLPLTIETLLQALVLPEDSRVGQRVPKKLLLEQGAPTAADKRLINEGIEEIQWLAALKPNSIGVAPYQDDQREYLEIAVLSLTLRGLADKPAKALRLAERLHRAVPYPVFLLTQNGPELQLTLVHKRSAQNEAGKVVLDGRLTVADLPPHGLAAGSLADFYSSLSLEQQPQNHLKAIYQGWLDRIDALNAAGLTGSFTAPVSPEQAVARRQALQDCEHLEAEINRLHSQAEKEKQLARQVELNLELKRVQAQLSSARGSL
jgi:hypothetical protein